MNIEIQVKLLQKASRTLSSINDSMQVIPSHHDEGAFDGSRNSAEAVAPHNYIRLICFQIPIILY